MEKIEDAFIVLVEDDPNSYLIIEELLKAAGFKNVYHRSSGAKLISLIEALPRVDLVLLDIGLPGESGFSIIERLRAHPKTANTQIAAVTANIMHETRLRAKDAGFNSFLSKPIRPDKITGQVRAMIEGRTFWW